MHDLVEHRGFRCSSPVVLELLFCLLPRVAPEHTGRFGDLGLPVVARSRDKDSGGAEVKAISKSIEVDTQDWSEVKQTLREADTVLAAAQAYSTEIENNDVPDSAATDRAQARIPVISKELTEARVAFERAQNDDWSQHLNKAHRILSRLRVAQKTMQDEDDAGRKAMEKFKQSSSVVRNATGWRGKYGISVDGNPGGADIARAGDLLRAGRYDEALLLVAMASQLAESAVEEAERNVRRETRRREEAAEAARRARQEAEEEEDRRRRSYSSSSSSSWSSSRSSSDSSSGGSWGSFSDSSSSGGSMGDW